MARAEPPGRPVTAMPQRPVLDVGQVHLRILATTDLHMHLLPWDYCADRPNADVGLVRMGGLIEQSRKEAANSLLLDNGDILQGTPMGDLFADRALRGQVEHPMIAAMNLMGYDAATIGNHEFNYGLDVLMTALAQARFPIVSANVATQLGPTARQDKTLLRPYVLIDRMMADASGEQQALRIGVLGLLPPQIMIWDRDLLRGRVDTRDILGAAAAYVPEMREAGADVIIALSHSGIGAAEAGAGMEHASLALAALQGIDAVVAGHSHQVFPSAAFAGRTGVDLARGTLAGKPATMAGAFGSHLGQIDLVLDRDARGWHVARGQGSVRRVPRVADPLGDRVGGPAPARDGRLIRAVSDAHAATLADVRRPVGSTALPLNTHFALVAPVPAVVLVAEAKRWHVAEQLRHTALAGVPVLATAAPFKAGGRGGPGHYTDVPAGPLAVRHVADLYAFPDTICAVLVTGDLLACWLERAAAAFRHLTPGAADQPLLDPDVPTSSFDMIFGLTYTFDLSRPARYSAQGDLIDPTSRRVGKLRYQGRPVNPADRFVIATNSYRAGGGARFPGAEPGRIVYAAPLRNREILRRYIAARDRIDAGSLTGPVWRFAPMPGTSAIFDTSPNARAAPGIVPGLTLEHAGPGPDGFARFRIRF